MANPFFDETLHFESHPDYRNHSLSMSNLEVGAVRLQMSFFIVDHYKRTTTLYSYNPELTDLFGTMGVKPLSNEFIERLFSIKNDNTFNTQVIETVNAIFKGDVLGNNNRTYCLSFNLPITLENSTIKMLRFKVMPYKFTNTSEEGIPWLTYYGVKKIDAKQPGCFKLIDINKSEEYPVFITEDSACDIKYDLLSRSDIEIVQLSSDGLTENEIAEQIDTTMTNMKYLKTSLLLRLNAKSISHAIAKVKKQGFI